LSTLDHPLHPTKKQQIQSTWKISTEDCSELFTM
jgi:hypothetical protein